MHLKPGRPAHRRRPSVAASRPARTGGRATLRAARNPNGTYSETAGGNANTWTNYTNAGGSQGPTVPGGATIEIACVVQGFRVADGNTNWYLIAQSPWNYNYYVAADAFYNNGATSGSLRGTPFVDPAVPACGSGGGVYETAGGAANTWTDYNSAGGQQGPTVGGGATIAIACKIQGFRVADGNTWWYRIAQTPWNNGYYVSADAFYNNGATSGSLRGTPFVDYNVPDCTTGGGSGGGGGTSSTPPGGKAETAGGLAHTWTNYTNAGGSEGPSIAGGQTVIIACKLTGFRVADGNTWWYQIASSPWNGNYYVSADAFYNNGATSGSLHGTPFVDGAVPDCVQTTGSGGSSGARALTETAGGAADTFGNYSHAGVPGPRVPAGATITITCRAQGFRVADGNTWWYLIGQAPWNNMYYVSADAFYNNGRTSGSLLGTPFYDPAVPICVNNHEAPLYSTSVATSNSTTHTTSCTYGHYPIDCASGDFWHTFTDIAIPGRGPGLTLTRTYNALNPTPGALFGYGWTSSFDRHLKFGGTDRIADGVVVAVLEDGSQIIGTPDGGGGFTTPASTDSSLVRNADGTYTLTRHHVDIETFSATGQLLSLGDLNGNLTTFAYDGANHLTTVTDASGRQLTVVTDSDGRITSITDPAGRQRSYTYDASGNLTSATDTLGKAWTYAYNSDHRMVDMTDPRGGVVHNVYDDAGRVTKQVDPAGLATTFAYSGDNFGSVGGETVITDPHGNVRREKYANGFLTVLTKGVGTSRESTWIYAYDPVNYGRTSETDPNGHVTLKTYDTAGHLLTSTDPLGSTTTYTYNALGQLTSKKTPDGKTTTKSYDARGNLLTSTDALGNTTTTTYDDAAHPGDPTSTVDADGHKTTFVYDSNGNVTTKSTFPSAGSPSTTKYVFDAVGNTLCVAPPNATARNVRCPPSGGTRVGATITNVYDNADRVTSTTDQNGHTTSYEYDGNGNRTKVTAPAGEVTTTAYDGTNRVTSVKRPDGSTMAYAYDVPAGTGACPQTTGATYCTVRTTPNGNAHVRSFDGQDALIRTALPSGPVTRMSYDLGGNRTTRTSASGVVTTYSYDAADRLTKESYSDGTTPMVTYAYDRDGDRTSMTDGTGTTSYLYDAAGQLLEAKNGPGATVAYEYDHSGHVVKLTYPNGKAITQVYDGAGRLSSVTDWLGRRTSFLFDADGNLLSRVLPNGNVVATTFDAAGLPTGMSVGTSSSTPLASITYRRDVDGRIVKRSESGAIAGAVNYAYDSNGRLKTADAQTFRFDAADNLVGNDVNDQVFNATDQLTSLTNAAGGVGFTYDSDGNRTSAAPTWGRATKYTYDGVDRLRTVGQPAVAPTVTRLSPSTGTMAGGTPVTITGSGFTEATVVKFDGVTATAPKVVSDTQLTVLTPAHTSGNAPVTVASSGGTSVSGADSTFAYSKLAGITAIAPTAGPEAGGNVVTIVGAGFTGATQVLFGTAKATALRIVSDTKMYATAPAGTSPHTITVKTPEGTSIPTDVARYTYANGPAVTATAPTAGPAAGGTVVTLRGAGFTGATGVKFGGQAATNVSVINDTQLTATAPAGTATASVIVTVGGKSSADSSASRFSYQAVPTVSGVLPGVGPAAGGNVVTLRGTDFQNATAVVFGGTQVPFKVVSSKTLQAVAPAGTSGLNVTVVTPGGTSAKTAATHYGYIAGGTSGYTYNGDGLRMTMTGPTGTVGFSWDTTSEVPKLLQDATNAYLYGPDGMAFEQINNDGTPNYYFQDALGSTRVLLTKNGAVGATYTYSPYGSLLSQTGASQTSLLYAGGQFDASTGLYYLINRYYDSTTGQFVTVDPVVDASESTYGYVDGNPISNSDPTGLLCLLGRNPNGSCRGGSQARKVVSVVHTASSLGAAAAGGCAIVAGLSIVGNAGLSEACGVAALALGGIALATGEIQYAMGDQSTAGLVCDAVGAVPFAKAAEVAMYAATNGACMYVNYGEMQGGGSVSVSGGRSGSASQCLQPSSGGLQGSSPILQGGPVRLQG